MRQCGRKPAAAILTPPWTFRPRRNTSASPCGRGGDRLSPTLDPHHLELLEGAADASDTLVMARSALLKDGLTVAGKDGPKAHPPFARLLRKLDLDCLQPPPELGGRWRCGQSGGYDHAHQAKAFEGDDCMPTVSITIRRCFRFIGSSASNTIAVTICCWSAAYVHSGSIMTSLRFPRTTASFRSYYRSNGFNLAGLGLEHPGRLHNAAASDADYLATKSFYHHHERLLAARRPGKGARTLLLELLEAVRRNDLHTATVGEVNAHWRAVAKWT